MNNSVFGKTTENFRKRIKVKLVNNTKDYKNNVSKSIFISQKIFTRNFVAIHEIQRVLTLDKLTYVGLSIFDLSKLLMYEFDYKNIKRKYNANLLFTDTDCQVSEIETNNAYEDFYGDKNLFDFSDYPQN